MSVFLSVCLFVCGIAHCYSPWCCSVRFGLVAGKMRLLVACYDSGIYVFEIGPGSLEVPSQDMPCQDLFTGKEAEEEEAVDESLLSAQQRQVSQTLANKANI